MVLGFGSKKKKSPTEPVFVRARPSLPELPHDRSIPWPEDLVDINAVQASGNSPPGSEGHGTPHGASKTSFQATRGPAIPFHKPFRTGEASTPGSPVSPNPNYSIASLYGSGVPPSSFTGVGPRVRAGSHPLAHSRSARRAKHPPTFNVMVAGAKNTGKSSLLRLFLDTSNISPTNTPDQLLSLATFRSSSVRPTSIINTACVEILQGRGPGPEDRVTLTCIDTPGLDFSEGKEFALDRAVSGVVKYVDMQFAETMGEESKVIRTSKGDQHVHLCIYLIDPDSIMTPSARQARSRLDASTLSARPFKPSDLPEPSEYDSGSDMDEGQDPTVVNGTTGSHSDDEYGPPEPTTASSTSPGEQIPRHSADTEDQTQRSSVEPGSPSETIQAKPVPSHTPAQTHSRLAMSPAEIRVIARLAKRVNVLPVIARADALTDGRLERIKRAVRRDLQAVGTEDDGDNASDGIFVVWDADAGAVFGRRYAGKENVSGNGTSNGHPHSQLSPDGAGSDPEDDERRSRPVIKLRERGSARGLTRSRSRKSLKAAVGAETDDPDPGTHTSPSSPSQAQDNALLGSPSRRTSIGSTAAASPSSYGAMFSRADLRARMPFAIIAPERENKKASTHISARSSQNGNAQGGRTFDANGRFVRRFRWGTVDVLDPQHCDFAPLRAAVLGSYMRALKAYTKDVLYERFRTEKLLARRATRNISDEDRKRILHDLGL